MTFRNAALHLHADQNTLQILVAPMYVLYVSYDESSCQGVWSGNLFKLRSAACKHNNDQNLTNACNSPHFLVVELSIVAE